MCESVSDTTSDYMLSPRRWFEDQAGVEAMRLAAAACLPRLPGPRSTSTDADSSKDTNMSNKVSPDRGLPALGLRAHQLPDITRTADLLVVAVG